MDNFDQLKQLWQQQSPVPVRDEEVAALKQSNADNQRKMERSNLTGAVLLLLTAVFILWMGFGLVTFHSPLTYVAVVLIALVSAIQGFIALRTYQRLRAIDAAAPVARHLAQWEQYYQFRKRFVRLNIPLYYLLLNGAFGLYFVEVLGHLPIVTRILALALYVAWMLYAYFVLGKRSLRKENKRLEAIINNLRAIQQQLTEKD